MAITAIAEITGTDVNVYQVKDIERATAFWQDVMGLELTFQSERFAEFELPDGSVFTLGQLRDGSWQRGGGIVFRVADVRAAAVVYRERGAQIDEETFDGSTCGIAFGEDSEGNTFILRQDKS